VALRDGKRLYRPKPAKFARRMRKAYAKQARA
jgi:hypothetical protein